MCHKSLALQAPGPVSKEEQRMHREVCLFWRFLLAIKSTVPKEICERKRLLYRIPSPRQLPQESTYTL